MEKTYRKKYYPEEITMEERLFAVGGRRAKIQWRKGLALEILGVVLGAFGLLAIDEDGGLVLIVLGGILLLVGWIMVLLHCYGMHCLERAELLYNTRVAAGYIETEKDVVICPNCHFAQPSGRTTCWECGTPLDGNAEETGDNAEETVEKTELSSNEPTQWVCPTCGQYITYGVPTCPHCGQVISWN